MGSKERGAAEAIQLELCKDHSKRFKLQYLQVSAP